MNINPRDLIVESVSIPGGLRAAEGGQVEGFVTVTGSLPDGQRVEAHGLVLLRTLWIGGDA